MHEIRQNKVTREWVIFATGRGKRPKDFKEPTGSRKAAVTDETVSTCPFCPENEKKLGPIVEDLPGKNRFGWLTRIIPNKYPVLSADSDTARYTDGLYIAMPGYGQHEVIIESPFHRREPAVMKKWEVEALVETYYKRYTVLMQDSRNRMVLIFRNHGPRAGASLVHPHSQIVATGIVPNYIRFREEQVQRYYDEWNRCVMCSVIAEEMKVGKRIVYQNSSFVVVVPYAAEVPYEMWIIPLSHQASFGSIGDREKEYFAEAMGQALSRLYTKFDDADYNYIIHSAVRYKANEPQLHWYLQIRPRVSTAAGFEIGSRIPINPTLPEDNARILRAE